MAVCSHASRSARSASSSADPAAVSSMSWRRRSCSSGLRDQRAADELVDAVGQRLHPHLHPGRQLRWRGHPGPAHLAEHLHLAQRQAVVGSVATQLAGHRHDRLPQLGGGGTFGASHRQVIPWHLPVVTPVAPPE
jgi:hypothetical protein